MPSKGNTWNLSHKRIDERMNSFFITVWWYLVTRKGQQKSIQYLKITHSCFPNQIFNIFLLSNTKTIIQIVGLWHMDYE